MLSIVHRMSSSRWLPFLQTLAKCYTYILFTVWTKRFASVKKCGKPKAKDIFKAIEKHKIIANLGKS